MKKKKDQDFHLEAWFGLIWSVFPAVLDPSDHKLLLITWYFNQCVVCAVCVVVPVNKSVIRV